MNDLQAEHNFESALDQPRCRTMHEMLVARLVDNTNG